MIARRRFVASLAAGSAAAAFPTAIVAQSRRTLRAAFVPSTLFAPLFVAAERGYLREAGFDAELTPIVAGQDSMALVAQGQFDLAGAALSAAFFNAVNRGLDVKFVASTGYQPRTGHPTALMAREDLWRGGLRSPAGLRGKKIGWIGGAGAASSYYVAVILRRYGMRLADVEGVNVSNPEQQAALTRGAIDAVFTSAPFPEVFEEQHLARIIGSVTPGISASGIFFGSTLLHDVERARAIMTALRRAAGEIAGEGYYRTENLEAYATYVKQPVALLRKADRYDFKPDLRLDQGTIEDMQRVFLAEGILAYKEPLNEVRFVARF